MKPRQRIEKWTGQSNVYSQANSRGFCSVVYLGVAVVCLMFLVGCMPSTPSTFPTPQQQQLPGPSLPSPGSSSPSQQPPSGSPSSPSSPSPSNPGSTNPLPSPPSGSPSSTPSLPMPSPSNPSGTPSLPTLPTLPSPSGPQDPNNGDPQNGDTSSPSDGNLPPPSDGEEGSEEDGTEGEGTGEQASSSEIEGSNDGTENGTATGGLMEMPEDSGGWEVSNQTPLIGPPTEEEELETEGEGSAETEDSQADEDFQRALEELDGEIMEERNEVIGRAHETVATQSGGQGIETVDDAGTVDTNSAIEDDRVGTTDETETEQGTFEGEEVAEVDIERVIDTPDAMDKDVIARQMREAAMTEEDPELKKKLWEEYETYKKGL